MKTPFILMAAALLAVPSLQARTWTQASTGKTLDGEMNELLDDKVQIIMSNGQSVELPISMLADEDKAFIEEWKKKNMTAAEGTEAAEGEPLPLPEEGPVEVTLADAHLCCGGCRKAVDAAVEGLEGVRVSTSGSEIVIDADDADAANEAVDKIASAGFYGAPSHAVKGPNPGSDLALADTEFSGLHLCCGKCTRSVEAALDSVDGVESYEINEDAGTVTVKGVFTSAAVVAALHKEGLHAEK